MNHKVHLNLLLIYFLFGVSFQSFASVPHETNLASIAFDQKLTVKTRWRALMALAITQEEKSLLHLENALKSKDWFMRNAGLIAMGQIAPARALQRARQLILDPALVVRTSAVMIFQQRGTSHDVDFLWNQLNNRINFKRKQSLWIRHHIVTAIGILGSPLDIPRLIALLDDQDIRVRKASVRALEILTEYQPYQQNNINNLTLKINHWKNYALSSP